MNETMVNDAIDKNCNTIDEDSTSVRNLKRAANLRVVDEDDEFECLPTCKFIATHDPAEHYDVGFVCRRVIAHFADLRPSSRPTALDDLHRFLLPHLVIINECSSAIMFNYLLELGAIAVDQEHRVHVAPLSDAVAIVHAHDERCVMLCTPDWWNSNARDERRTNEITSDSFAAIASNVLRGLFAQPVAPMNAIEFRQLLAHVCISETSVRAEPVVQELVNSGVIQFARHDQNRLRIRLPSRNSK
jgi:hypothetical protein